VLIAEPEVIPLGSQHLGKPAILSRLINLNVDFPTDGGRRAKVLSGSLVLVG
jgi:hypothetical protein